MILKIKRIRKFSFFETIALLTSIYLVLKSFFPPMQSFPEILDVAFLLGWFISAYCMNSNYFKKMPVYKWLFYVFMLYVVLVPYLFNNLVISNRYISIAQIFIFYIIYDYNINSGHKYQNGVLVKVSIPFIVYTLIKTLTGLLNNPYLSRSIKNSGDYSIELLKQGVGGYSYIYFLLFIAILTFYLAISSNLGIRLRNRVLLFVFFLLCSSVIILSNYFTCISLLMLSIILMILLKLIKKKNILTLLIMITVSIIILLYYKEISISVLEFAIDLLSDGKTRDRLLMILNDLLVGNSDSSITSDRFLVLKISWDSFLENPITGIVFTKIQMINNYLSGFGQHSQILDTFALYGFFVGILQVFCLVKPLKKHMDLNSKFKDLFIVVTAVLLLLAFFNNITPATGFVSYLLIPTVLTRFENTQKSLALSKP